MPLARQIDGEDRGRRTRRRLYAFRVYVRRPWFVSGHGERLAVGCHVGTPLTGPRDTLNRAYSQWGEDPLARARAGASRRLPRAADFRAAGTPELDPSLYPPGSPEGRDPVLYLDDVVRDAAAVADGDPRLALASFAVHWDDAQRLWYCDIELAGDFTGWLGLALYRHQPLAHEGTQLSPSSTWVREVARPAVPGGRARLVRTSIRRWRQPRPAGIPLGGGRLRAALRLERS